MSLSNTVAIPHSSLLDAIATANRLNGALGRDCWLDVQSYTLRASLDLIDGAIERAIRQQQQPTPPPSPKPPPQRIDRWLVPSDQDYTAIALAEADFTAAWLAAGDDRAAQQQAYRSHKQAQRRLRDKIALPFAQIDFRPDSLIYSDTPRPEFEGATVLPSPDGRTYKVHTVMHWSHPKNSTVLKFRTHRVEFEREIRYFVRELDEANYTKQEQPPEALTPEVFRGMLAKTF